MTQSHGLLMDHIYRRQRRIYDVTRKYYLLGRDHLIDQMAPAAEAHILELACGTGRNLDLIDRRHPGRHLYGLDISAEMLASARGKLGNRAMLKQGDACQFDPQTLFGRSSFDHIVLSYSVSMIPDWRAALSQSLLHLAPGGALHVVDFGDQSKLPHWFRRALRSWLAHFHVSPRDALATEVDALAHRHGFRAQHMPLYRSYAQFVRLDHL